MENKQKSNDQPTMDPGEAVVLFAVVIMSLLAISGIMVRLNSRMHLPLPKLKIV